LFWTDEWQEGEREVDKDLKAGRVKTFEINSPEDIKKFLHKLNEDKNKDR
jgi:hypothetical protein